MNQRTALMAVACAYLAASAALVYWLAPNPSPSIKEVVGLAMPFHSAGKSPDEGIQVAGVVLSCRHSLWGLAYGCNVPYQRGASSRAVYFSESSALARLGISEPTHLLLRLEQDNRTVFACPPADYRTGALLGSLSFYALLVVGFSVIAHITRRLIRRPNTRKA